MARFISIVRSVSALFALKTRFVKPAFSNMRTYFFSSLSIRDTRFELGISGRFKSRMLASLTPSRIAVLCIFAESIIRMMWRGFLMFPGLRRIFAAPASIASIARAGEKCMSAISGMAVFCTILAKAAVSAFVGTAIRMRSQPAVVRVFSCLRQRGMSVVGHLVMDWMAMGWPLPSLMGPMRTVVVFRLFIMLQIISCHPGCDKLKYGVKSAFGLGV